MRLKTAGTERGEQGETGDESEQVDGKAWYKFSAGE